MLPFYWLQDGAKRQDALEVTNLRPIGAGELYATFSLVGSRAIELHDLALFRRRRDGVFFVAGQQLLDAAESRYRRVVSFKEPFATVLMRQIRTELESFYDEYSTESEVVRLSDQERGDTETRLDDRIDSEKMIRFDRWHRPRGFHGRRVSFDATLGESIVVRYCRLAQKGPGTELHDFRVLPPTSEHLKVRPVIFGRDFERAIIEAALSESGPPPSPPIFAAG